MVINGVEYTKEKLAKLFDYAILDPDMTEEKIKLACNVAKKYNFKGVHANPVWVETIANELEGYDIETGLVISFPFGAVPTSFKIYEAKELINILNKRPGCIDVVTNLGKLKDKDYKYYKNDIAEIVKIGKENGLEVKAILEVALLTDDEVKAACECAVEAGVDFVKTSTGRNGNPAIKHVKIMKESVPKHIGIKFSGFGSYNASQLTIMALDAGATRFGSRKAPEIVDEIEYIYNNLKII